jgi:septal ring factor EnvC (AmiA/AmiB activator)
MPGFRTLLLTALLCTQASLALAKDVSAQQVGVEYARENQERAEKEHKGDLQRVADAEKRLAEAQKQLAEDRQRAEASRRKLDDANAKLVRAQQLLDKAWKE